MEVLETIGSAFSAVGNFFASLAESIAYFVNFVGSCVSECAELLGVIPTFLGTMMVAGFMFSVVLAIKRMVID